MMMIMMINRFHSLSIFFNLIFRILYQFCFTIFCVCHSFGINILCRIVLLPRGGQPCPVSCKKAAVHTAAVWMGAVAVVVVVYSACWDRMLLALRCGCCCCC